MYEKEKRDQRKPDGQSVDMSIENQMFNSKFQDSVANMNQLPSIQMSLKGIILQSFHQSFAPNISHHSNVFDVVTRPNEMSSFMDRFNSKGTSFFRTV